MNGVPGFLVRHSRATAFSHTDPIGGLCRYTCTQDETATLHKIYESLGCSGIIFVVCSMRSEGSSQQVHSGQMQYGSLLDVCGSI